VLRCPSCGQENPDIARFCLACAAPIARTSASPSEERKVVTVLFCDLVGFTALSDQADPEDVRATLRPYHLRLQQEIERFGGTVEKFIGDAVMAVYGAPVAHEDDPERAVRSGLRILGAIGELNETHPNLELAVRIGINTGDAVVALSQPASREGIVTGDVVNTASRLESVAPPGGVVVGESTYRATKDFFEYDQLEPVRVKGKAEPLPIWLARASRSRYGSDVDLQPTTPFVGREDELEVLKRSYARTLRERSVQLVTLLGEPGVGKSRLVREFFTYTDNEPEIISWRQGRCLPYGEGITFWPLGEIVKAQAGVLESDDPEEASTKLDIAIQTSIEDETERGWLKARLAPLVGVAAPQATGATGGTGATERIESFTAWRRFLEGIATIRPLVLVFEDLHWADNAMLEFLDHLVEWSADVPMLVVCTARPELYERHPGWGGGKRNSTTISLPPLSAEEIWLLMSALLPLSPLPDGVPALILERAGGNPLYAEEFIRMLSDHEVTEEGKMVITSMGVGLPFPESIQAIIAARLDTLSPERKALLQDSAVIGKVFWSGALASMGGLAERVVQEGLHELARKELVRSARTSSMKDQEEFTFWHFLIRDVAYGQIPRAARARKHRAVAEWTEQVAGERVADHAEVISYHYRQALELSRAAGVLEDSRDLEEPTRRFLVMAGDRAMGLDQKRASEHYRHALDHMPLGSAERGAVLVKAAEAAAGGGRFAEAEGTYEEAISELRGVDDLRGAGDAMVRLSILLWHRGEAARCRAVLGQATELLEREPPSAELAHAYAQQAESKLVEGLFDEALQWSKKSLGLADMLGVEEYRPATLGVQGMARWYLGQVSGIDDLRQAIALSVDLGLARETARMQSVLSELLWVTEGPRSGVEASRAAIELSERRGNADLAMAIRAQDLGPLFDLGEWDELVTAADHLIRWSRTTGEGYFTVVAESYKTLVLLWRGALGAATSLSRTLLPAAREIGEGQVLVRALAAAALVEQTRGRLPEARALVDELEQVTRDRPGWYRAEYLPDLVRVCVAAGDIDAGDRLIEGLPVHALRHRVSLMTAEAILQEARDEAEKAAAGYAQAAERWRDYGHVLERGRALLGAARCLHRLGRSESQGMFEQARSILAGLGAEPLIGETDRWLQQARAPLA
jgi:class 3 adenylate cyclase/tetratricopeptide (TPR) repeat protein